MKLFRRKITPEYIGKHYKLRTDLRIFETYEIGQINDAFYDDTIFLEIRDESICLLRGDNVPSYWLCNIEYIYQLRQILKIYKIL